MNIFFLHSDPKKCAQYHCDKHVVKMILESAQMLCTAHHCFDSKIPNLYKKTHVNHPSSVWVRESKSHYKWLYNLFVELCEEYKYRYGKVHKTDAKLRKVLKNPPKGLKDAGFVDPPQAMPEEYRSGNSVKSYRKYYNEEKYSFCTWKERDVPEWFRRR